MSGQPCVHPVVRGAKRGSLRAATGYPFATGAGRTRPCQRNGSATARSSRASSRERRLRRASAPRWHGPVRTPTGDRGTSTCARGKGARDPQPQLFVLATPRHLESDERVPLVVLLHGLGETGDARMGAWAWLERYGLGTSYDRLPRGRLDARARAGLSLHARSPHRRPPRLRRVRARWLVDTVLPRARREAPSAFDAPAFTYARRVLARGSLLPRGPPAPAGGLAAWAGVQDGRQRGRRGGAVTARVSGRPGRTPSSSRRAPATLSVRATRPCHAPCPGPASRAPSPSYRDPTISQWLRRSGTARMLSWLDDLPRPERRPDAPLRYAPPR